jgi:hypothetical protein
MFRPKMQIAGVPKPRQDNPNAARRVASEIYDAPWRH